MLRRHQTAMKKLLVFMFGLTMLFSCEALEGYDDSELRDKVDNLENRVAQLEQLCQRINSDVTTLQALVDAMQGGEYITDITIIKEGGKDVGYTITFASGNSVTIYHGRDGKDGANGQDGADGKDGQDGKDGYTPQISVRQDTDGNYYWTLDGDWLYDDNGNKIRANGKDGADGKDGQDGEPGADGEDGKDGADGKDGQDGVTPQFKIQDDYWYISYDNGASWTRLGKATGEDGKDGADGEDGKDGQDGADGAGGSTVVGDSIIKELTQDEGYVYITLYDGTQFVLPKMSKAFTITFDQTENIAISPNQSVKIKYTVTGVENAEIEALGKDGWQAEVEPATATTGVIKVTAPSTRATGKVIVFVSNGAGQTLMKSLTFGEGVLTGVADCYECYAQGGDIKIEVRTNLDYTVSIPDEAAEWISAKVTRAEMRDETLTLTIQPSTTGVDRSAQIELLGTSGNVLQSVEIIQRANNTSAGTISFKDPAVEAICVQNFDADQDGKLSYAEAAAVTGIGTIFKDNTSIRFFDEFQYFTGVTVVADNAFYGCNKLINITLPSTIANIKSSAFYECTNLSAIHIPASCNTISENAFRGCTHLQVTFDEGLVDIGYNAFQDCTRLTEVVLPNSLVRLGTVWGYYGPTISTSYGAVFQGCTALKKVTLPEHLDIIPNSTFKDCINLETINLPDWLSEIHDYAFENCKSLKNIVFPEYLDKIGNCAFKNCTSLTEIKLPEYVSKYWYDDYYQYKYSYEYGIFYGSGLQKIEFPEGMTKIPDGICYGCRNLTEAIIPESVKTIGETAFRFTAFTEFEIPAHIETINRGAFWSSKVTTVTIPTTLKSIGNSIFEDCDQLTSVTIAEGRTNLGDYMFNNCDALTDVTLPSTLTHINGHAFKHCSALTSIELPASLKTIGDSAFAESALASITIPNGVTSLGNYAIASTPLTEVEFLASVTSLGEGVLQNCDKLTSVTLPASITAISTKMFESCDALTEYTVPATIKSIGDNAFQNCDKLATITVSEGVTSIGRNTFYKCPALTTVNLPETLKSIDYYAFQDCTALKEIELPNSITSLGCYMFQNCTALTKCNIPTNVECTSIAGYMFSGCTALTEFTMPDNITLIGFNAFYGCSKLATINLSQNLKRIDEYAFYGCKLLNKIKLPATLTTIENWAFAYCSSLSEVYCYATTPPSAGSGSTWNSCPRTKLYVPQASILQYKNAAGWNGFTTISAIPTE